MGYIIFGFIVLIFIIDIVVKLRSCDKGLIWQPTSFIIIYLTYYVLLPFIKGGTDASGLAQTYLLIGTLLFYIVFKVVYNTANPKTNFSRINTILDKENGLKYAIILFIVAFIGYGAFNGFSLSVFSSASRDDIVFNEEGSYGHTEMYITYLISVFTFCCAVAYAVKEKLSVWFAGMVALAMIIYIIGGFRYRILMLFVAVFTVIYLFPHPKKIKYQIVIPLFLVMYVFMGVMEAARMYGHGLDMNVVSEIQRTREIKEASENMMVYEFSAECMEKYDIGDYIWLEPITTAVLMPIPRALFPRKPKGMYMRDANMKIYGTITHGNAFLNITEAYVSFGWLGIILYAVFLGWLSKLFWINYERNKDSLGAIVLLGLYNATLYQIIARGYMAQALTTFIYYVFMPFWLIMLLRKLNVLK